MSKLLKENIKTIVSSQEQAIAAWIEYLKDLRVLEMIEKLSEQDCNLEKALDEVLNVRDFLAYPKHILGSELQKHGEMAEHMQVAFSNAEDLIKGLKAAYTFDGVARFAPEDYLCDGHMVQSKFYQTARGTLSAIKMHLKLYPNFLKNGGFYEIAKDKYEILAKIYEDGERHPNLLTSSDKTIYNTIKEWETQNSTNFLESVRPAKINYEDAMLDVAENTINNEEAKLRQIDDERRQEIKADTAPTLKEGLKATGVSIAVEAGANFALGIYHKIKEGKRLNEFTEEDWKAIGVDTAKGALKGGVRGSSVYALTNFCNTPAPIANAFVSAVFGIIAQANKLSSGIISPDEFFENSEILCLDVSVSALCSTVGQVLIPVPVLGSIIGNAVGMVMLDIAKTFLTEKEQQIIEKNLSELCDFKANIDESFQSFISDLDVKMKEYKSLVEMAFDEDINVRVYSSIDRARFAGVTEDLILKNKEESDAFFLSKELAVF